MAQPYLAQLEELASTLDGAHELVCKHFFSGAALYLEGRICATLTPKGLAFKLSVARSDELINEGKGLPLKYFERSPVKKGYVLFPEYRDLGKAEITSRFKECIRYSAQRNA